MKTSQIELSQNFTEWEWYEDINVTRLYLHLLLCVNYKDVSWKGIFLEKGSVVSSVASLSTGTKLSTQMVKTALAKLIDTGYIKKQRIGSFTVITITNYDNIKITE